MFQVFVLVDGVGITGQYYFNGAHPIVSRKLLKNKWSVHTTIFYQNHATCFGSLSPSSGVYRLEIYRQLQLIIFESPYW